MIALDHEMINKNARTTGAIKLVYDGIASSYDRARFGSPGGHYVDTKEREFVARMIEGHAVLEIGTATGRFAVTLIETGAEYVGADLSINMLRKACQRTHGKISVVQMDGTMLGFKDHFDSILCVRTFHFFQEPLKGLHELFKTLKPGGVCLVTFETDNFIRRIVLYAGIGVSEQYYYRISDIEEMLLKAGFNVLRKGTVIRLPVTFYRKCPERLVPLLSKFDKIWPWPMDGYVKARKSLSNC